MTFSQQVTNSAEWANGTGPHAQPVFTGGDTGDRLLTAARRVDLINHVVAQEIMPRLAAAQFAGRGKAPALAVLADAETTELVRCLLSGEEDQAGAYIDGLVALGFHTGDLYLGIITDAARHLGELWAADRCSFAMVTIAAGRLQRIVRLLSPAFLEEGAAPAASAGTILLLPAPREQHTLGVIILSEFFRRDGWHVLGGPVAPSLNAPADIRTNWIDVAGFSIASIGLVDGLAALIREVRRASRNRFIGIMVGGPLMLERPELLTRLGADTTATDAPGTVRQARAFVKARSAVA